MLALSLAVGLPGLLAAAPAPSGGAEALIATVEDVSRPIAETKKAVQALGDLGDPRAVPALVKLLYEDRQGRTLAAEAAFALFELGRPSADALLRVVRRKDPQLLAWATAHHLPETWLLGQSVDVLGDLGDARAQAPLLELLRYDNANQPLALVIRRHAASALGRLRSRAAVAPLTNLVNAPNVQARHEVVQALMSIGGREALPALARAASEGEWELRIIAINGFTMLGDDREKPAFQQMLQREEGLITSDCKAHPNYQGCDNQKALLDRMLAGIRAHGSRLEAAGRCKQELACWTERMQDADPEVRQRAVLELGRRASAKQLDPLVAALGDKDAPVQFTAVQGLEWLLATDTAARAQGRRHLEALEARLAKGEGTVAGARFDAPLRRLIFRLRGPGAPHAARLGTR